MRHEWQRPVAIAVALWTGAVLAAADEESVRLAEYVSPSFLSEPVTMPEQFTTLSRSITVGEDVIAVSRHRTDADRWIEFQEEYRIRELSSSWALSMIQLAKFQLDKLSFTAKETARKLEFTYDLGSPAESGPRSVHERPSYSLPLFGNFEQLQLRTVLTERDSQTKSPFVGFQFNTRFGKGAPDYR